MLLSVITANAQKSSAVSLNRDFLLTGRCLLYFKSEEPTKNDECNYQWELQNRVIGGDNFAKLYIKDNNGNTVDFAYWNGKVKIIMIKSENGMRTYAIGDDMFIHLRIIEFDGTQFGHEGSVYAVSLCSIMRDK